MKPHFGEMCATIDQLRSCPTNYVVQYGYLIEVTKSYTTKLQVNCGFENKGKRCTFKLWSSWMKNKKKQFKLRGFLVSILVVGCTCMPHWLILTGLHKFFLKHLSARPRMKAREMKEEIKKKYLCLVS